MRKLLLTSATALVIGACGLPFGLGHASTSQLENGARLDEVELPLLTTWEQWVRSAGNTVQSLVASSFASGLGHRNVGDADTSVLSGPPCGWR